MNMKLAFCVLLGFSVGVFIWAFCALGQADGLREENERLRLFNARRERRIHKPPPVINWESCTKAGFTLGADPYVIAAIWRQENGPPDIETGSLGKTDFFAKNLPVKDWPAFEAGRTINRMAWEWFAKTPEGKEALKRMLKYSGEEYAALVVARGKVWGKNVYTYQEKFRKEK
jgi:hypothetical protein